MNVLIFSSMPSFAITYIILDEDRKHIPYEIFKGYQNNEWISEEELASTVNEIKELIENSDCKPTIFELETALAFYWLNKKNCDFAVIETGMGGRLDATNVTDKILSVITPIAIDHTKFLGNTIEEIAKEKAGIIKDIAISSAQHPQVQKILENNGSVTFVKNIDIKDIRYDIDKTTFDYKEHKNIEISMLGKYQVENACLAIEVLEKLNTMGYKINNIKDSIKNTQWLCRFHVINKKPLVIIDGAHNPHGVKALKKNIDLYLKNKDIVFITGVLKDKDYDTITKIMSPLAKKIFTIQSDSPRALSAVDYGKVISKYNKNVIPCTSIKKAVNSALKYDNILVFGSLSFMGEIESSADRKREIHWGPRTLDIDIILFENKIINDSKLTIPHIDMENRLFVLNPLTEIAPYAINPVNNKSVRKMYEKLKTENNKN